MSENPRRACPEVKEIGITELFVPEDSETVADLIFVHGLKGHPRKTWECSKSLNVSSDKTLKFKSKLPFFGKRRQNTKDTAATSSSKDNGTCYWPFNLLPSDFDRIRILTYGYDSHPSHFYKTTTNQMTISQHGRDLLTRITNSRRHCLSRPLMFVAHSLGGILVKDAIVESKKYTHQPRMQAVANRCRAVFFFGTPHLGSSFAEWGRILSNIVGALPGGLSMYDGVLRGLSPDSEKLDSLSRDFNDMLNANVPNEQKLKIFTFQESKGVSTLAGFDGKVVPDRSSTFGRRDIEISTFVNRNHMNMCRFRDATNPAYDDFRANLSDVLHDLQTCATVDVGEEGDFQEATFSNPNGELTAILKRLDFEGRQLRESQLGNLQTYAETFDWIWKSSFGAWVSEKDKNAGHIFWIYGKPASGKSTLMHYISNSANLPTMLFESTQHTWSVVYHFFDFRASEGIRNNFEGFLRSLLYQLFSDGDENETRKRRADTIDSSREQLWSVGYLRKTLDAKLKQDSSRVFLLLDGLDEYQGNQWELAEFLRQIAGSRVRLCLASRPEPVFEASFEYLPKLKMQAVNREGIENFVTLTLERSLPNCSFFVDSDIVSLSRNIGQRADGMFLWARFATYELAEGYARGEDLPALEERLEQLPPELEDIYSRIFRRLKPRERHEAGCMLQLVCFARRTLTIEELMAALEHVRAKFGFHLTKISKQICHQFERRIKNTTGGVLEIFESRGNNALTYTYSKRKDVPMVQIIHKTVRAYLDSRGWQEILPGPREDLMQSGALWLHVCIGQFALKVNCPPWFPDDFSNTRSGDSCTNDDIVFATSISYSDPLDSVPDTAKKSAPLREYAAIFMFDHALRFEDTFQIPVLPLIERGLTLSFMQYHWFFFKNSTRICSCTGTGRGTLYPRRPFHLAIAHGLARSVSKCLAEEKYSAKIDIDDKRLPFWLPEKLFGTLNADLVANSYQWEASEDFHKSLPTNSEEMSILEYAVRVSADVRNQGLPILHMILNNYPQIDDSTMIAALGMASHEVIRLLLPYKPEKIIHFVPDQDPVTFRFLSRRIEGLLLTSKEANILADLRIAKPVFSSFWIFARGLAVFDDEDSMNLFLERRGSVNDQCSPFGTILHSAIGNSFVFRLKFMQLLINAGADVNAQGLLGNPLEHAWLLLNSHDQDESGYYSYAIKPLIKNGAVNNRKDPNGCIPTKEWILYVCNLEGEESRARFKLCTDLYAGSGPYPTPPLPPSSSGLEESD